MVTFLLCSLDDIKTITQNTSLGTGNLYATCSRKLASQIKAGYGPNMVCSTGGPNTLVKTEWTPTVREATIRMSATIESSGQECTALRHAVVPDTVSEDDMRSIFAPNQGIASPPKAVQKEMFDGVYMNHEGTKGPVEDGDYTHLQDEDAFMKVNRGFPRGDMNEYWRKVVVDFSQLEKDWDRDDNDLYLLATWLNLHQPISLAIYDKKRKAFRLGRALFEKTGSVVYTVGSTDDTLTPPALSTCQARPQEAEIFGEFPPRNLLEKVSSLCPKFDSFLR
jgi:hypothetical protein